MARHSVANQQHCRHMRYFAVLRFSVFGQRGGFDCFIRPFFRHPIAFSIQYFPLIIRRESFSLRLTTSTLWHKRGTSRRIARSFFLSKLIKNSHHSDPPKIILSSPYPYTKSFACHSRDLLFLHFINRDGDCKQLFTFYLLIFTDFLMLLKAVFKSGVYCSCAIQFITQIFCSFIFSYFSRF